MVLQGWLARGDAYTHPYDQITSDIDSLIEVINASLLWLNDIHGAWAYVTNILSTVGKRGVILKPLEKHMTAICDFLEPKSLTNM